MFRYYWQLLNLLTDEIHEVGRGAGYASAEAAKSAARRFVASKWPDVDHEDIGIRIWRGPKELRHKTECVYCDLLSPIVDMEDADVVERSGLVRAIGRIRQEGKKLNMQELEDVGVEELGPRGKIYLAMLMSKLRGQPPRTPTP